MNAAWRKRAKRRLDCHKQLSTGAPAWPCLLEIFQNRLANRLHKRVVLCPSLLGTFDRHDLSGPIQIVKTQSPDFATSEPVDGKQFENRMVTYVAEAAAAGAVDEALNVSPDRTFWEPLLFN